MSKRVPGKFKRQPRDLYETPAAAVPALLPYLRGVRRFAEPCCGNGALIRHLESAGLRCVDRGDIATGQDALARTRFRVPVITNPPFDTRNRRELMHALIAHFMQAAPFVWLLIDSDWSTTKIAAPFIQHCTDIVPIGRLKWIAGSEHCGFDNFAWYRFDINHTAGPIFHARGAVPPDSSRASVLKRADNSLAHQRLLRRERDRELRQRRKSGKGKARDRRLREYFHVIANLFSAPGQLLFLLGIGLRAIGPPGKPSGPPNARGFRASSWVEGSQSLLWLYH